MQSPKILLIGGNFYPERTGIGKYSGEMIDWLAKNGFDCSVITTFPYYPEWKVHEGYRKRKFWYKREVKNGELNSIPINIVRCPHYVPANPSGLKRIISDFTFFLSSYLIILKLLFTSKYEYIITVAPSFSLGLLGILYRKVRGGKFIYHIQDLQIDAARDLQLIKSNFILNVFFKTECFILKRADAITTISDGMLQKVRAKCGKEVMLFPNWADVDCFYPITAKVEIKEKFGFSSTDRIILYSGAIGVKQGLEAIMYAAKHFENVEDIKFVICGTGPYKAHLLELKHSLGVTNVIFMPLQSLSEFNSFLNIADLHLVLQKGSARDLVMPSKLTTILSVGGVAIVAAEEGSTLSDLISSTNMGILIQPELHEELITAIEDTTAAQIKEKSKIAREYAVKNLSRERILSRFTKQVLEGV